MNHTVTQFDEVIRSPKTQTNVKISMTRVFGWDKVPSFFSLHRLHSDDRVTSDIDDHPLTGGKGPLTICPVCDANPRPGRLQPTQSQPYQYRP